MRLLFNRTLAKVLAITVACLAMSAQAAGLSSAKSAPDVGGTHRVDVVKIMSLSCPVCRASEPQDRPISQAATNTGGKFVWAPLPTGENLEGAKELVYYASRDFGADFSEKIKQSLYKGSQDMAIPMGDYLQVYVWLQQDLPDIEPQMKALFESAQAPATRKSLVRAARIATEAGVQNLPAYVLLVDSQVTAVLDPTTVPGNSLTALREEVLTRIQKLSQR